MLSMIKIFDKSQARAYNSALSAPVFYITREKFCQPLFLKNKRRAG
ncbi:hypothetical protein [Oscillospiraceae bacterium]|nr:hypothetical protein [Oscillospiraceae bacterium]